MPARRRIAGVGEKWTARAEHHARGCKRGWPFLGPMHEPSESWLVPIGSEHELDVIVRDVEAANRFAVARPRTGPLT